MFEYPKNEAIKEYTTNNGEKKYMFNIYLGTNPVTKMKKRTTRRGFKTPAAANAAFRKLESNYRNNKIKYNDIPTTSMTFRTAYEKWFDESYKGTVQSSTLYKTKQIFDCHILPEIGDVEIDKITSSYLQPIVNSWAHKYKKLNIVSRYANRVFTYFYTLKLISDNPFNHVLLPKRNINTTSPKNRVDNFFSSDELSKFTKYLLSNQNNIDFNQIAFFITMAYTGMRKGELLALTWKDVNFDAKTIDINKTLVMNESGALDIQPPKWGSYRVISINNLVTKILLKYKELISLNSELLFPNQKGKWRNLGKPNNWLKAIIKNGTEEYKTIYGITKDEQFKTFVHDITPHGLRHTHVTWLFETDSTITPKTVQVRLGHQNISITMDIYEHVTSNQTEKLKSALEVDFDPDNF